MSLVYTPAKKKLLDGALNLGSDDIRALLVMTNTTADTDEDAEFIGDIGTLDEMDGANYARQALANEATAADTPNDRATFDADDVTFASLGAGTRQVAGLVLYKHVTNDADSPVIAFIDSGGFPFAANGLDLVVQWNADGILTLT